VTAFREGMAYTDVSGTVPAMWHSGAADCARRARGQLLSGLPDRWRCSPIAPCQGAQDDGRGRSIELERRREKLRQQE